MKMKFSTPAARQFALMALAGCASVSAAYAAQTLRYNFENITDPTTDIPTNLVVPAGVNGTFVHPEKIGVNTDEEVLINSVRYLLGKTLQFVNVDGETDTAGHIDTMGTLADWGIANVTYNRDYTAMAWVKFESAAADNIVFGQLDPANNIGLHLGTRNGNFHSGHWGDDIGPDQGAATTVAAGTGSWQHVAWVNSGTNQSIYKNGVLVVGPGAPAAANASSSNLLIGTFINGNGSFVGALDEVKVFGDTALTAAQIQTEMTNTLTAVPLAVVTSAKLTNTGYTFTIKDFTPNSIVNPASVELIIDGFTVTASASKAGDVTTITYLPTLPDAGYGSMSLHSYTVNAKDQSNPATPNITATGNLQMPVLPPVIAGPAGTTSGWGVREFRGGPAYGTIVTAVDTLSGLTEPLPVTGIFDGSAPVMNHGDLTGATTGGSKGNFNNDLPFIGSTGVEDDNIAFVGKSQLVIPSAGDYSFSVHVDDGFALRISGGPAGNTGRFTSSNRNTATNGIDPADPQTIFYSGGSADAYTTGIYNFSAPGTYDILMVAYEGTGGAYYELAWAPGAFKWDYQTATWTLVGNPNDPTVLAVPFSPRFPATYPGPLGSTGTWGVRTFYGATVGSTETVSNWLRDTGVNLPPDEATVYDRQRANLNMSDNRNTAGEFQNPGYFANDYTLPGAVGLLDDSVDNMVHMAKGRVRVTVPGPYTFNARGDDGFFLRIKALSGPNPEFLKVSHPDFNNGEPRLDMSNRNEMWFNGGSGDTQTRGVINLTAGDYDIEYFNWQGGGGAWYELTAAVGDVPHPQEPREGWRLIGFSYDPPAPPTNGLPQISAAGWNVESTAPGSVVTSDIAGARLALTNTGTSSTWDAVNFTDPEAGGGPASPVPPFPWPRNTSADDQNYAMRATGNLVVPVAATYRLGFQGDDGGYLIIRGTGGNPNPSWETTLLENATGVGVVEAEDTVNAPLVLNQIRTETGTGNSRTIGRITLQPGTYQLEGLVYEGTGGSYWGIVGAIEPVEPVDSTAYLPLTKAGVIAPLAVMPLVSPVPDSIPVTNFAYNPTTGAVSLTFVSTAGSNYQLEYSTTMQAGAVGVPETWNISPGANANFAGAAGTTTLNFNISTLQVANGGVLPAASPRVFLRVRAL